MGIINVDLGDRGYSVAVGKNLLNNGLLYDFLGDYPKALIVTDDGVPTEYVNSVASFCKESFIYTLNQGDDSKNMDNYAALLSFMLDKGFTRKDCVAAVGGGMVGDIAGFAAASYMRGIAFFNFPTTLLSMVDSSVGGKTGINFGGVKNIVGAFYQPKTVFADIKTLKTLPQRQKAAGMAEAVKMALTSDKELFEFIENAEDPFAHLDEIIPRAIGIKKNVVEQDEKEAGLRRVLNFGHTLAHAIEPITELYHGECVALGMLPMCSDDVRSRLLNILKKLSLPTGAAFDREAAYEIMLHDKKGESGFVNAILVNEVGSFEEAKLTFEELGEKLNSIHL